MFVEEYGGRSMKKENNDVLSDELLRLAAKQFADEEGEKYYKAALELNTQNLEMPTEAQLSKFKKICAKEFRKKKRTVKTRYRVAVVVAVALFAFNISVVSVPAMRQFITNFLIEITDTHSKIKISDSEAKEREKSLKNNKYRIKFDKEYSVNYLPKGYYAVEEIRQPSVITINFENENGGKISFQQHFDYMVTNVDSENANTEYVDINGSRGILYSEKGYQIMIWKVKEYFLQLTSKNVSEKELIKIAENVK